MRDPDPIGNDLRRGQRQRQHRKGTGCAYCGETNPEVLKRARRSLLQGHHPAGETNDRDLWVILCLNCHARNTIRQPGAGIDLSHDPQRPMPERLVYSLRGRAVFFELLATSDAERADELAAFIAQLDAHFPAWRELPMAQPKRNSST